jgi:prolyl 4-hydroxylase
MNTQRASAATPTLHDFLQVPRTWLDWIATDLNRGCSPTSLIEIMIKEGFSEHVASAAVFQVSSYKHQNSPVLTAFQYEKSVFPVASHIHTPDRIVHVSARLTQPFVAILDNLLSHEECDALIDHAKASLKPSLVVDNTTGGSVSSTHRTSQGVCYQSILENDLIATIERRIAYAVNHPIRNGEAIQVLNYQVGEQYKPHFDYFDLATDGGRVNIQNGGNRVATVVMYLNDVEAGGQTDFPSIGFSVNPKKCSAVYFEYGNSLGQSDDLTLHAGSPVLAGEKWIATKWLRARDYHL